MYSGHGRLSACLSLSAFPHYCMDLYVTWGNGTGVPSTTTTTTVLRSFFRDHPGEPVREENFWTLWCKGRLTEADTLTIWLGATPSGLTIAHLHHHPFFCRPDSIPATQPTMSKHWRQLDGFPLVVQYCNRCMSFVAMTTVQNAKCQWVLIFGLCLVVGSSLFHYVMAQTKLYRH